MKRSVLSFIAIVAMLAGFCMSSSAQDSYLYRFYDSVDDQQFYTTNLSEAVYVISTLHWTYEGIEARVWSNGGDGRIPVYRLYNWRRGDHRYVSDVNVLINDLYGDYVYEGVGWYLYPYKILGTYKLYNSYRDYAAPSYFLWWQTSPGHSQDELLSMRLSEMTYATNHYGFGGQYGLVGFLGYAAPGYSGVN